MEAQDYLNQISKTSVPLQKPKSSFFSSKLFKILLAAVAVIIVAIAASSIVTSVKNSRKNDLISLKLHLDNLSETISDYQPLLKSSALRSSSASLSSIISNTNSELTTYLTEIYDFNAKKVDETLTAAEAALSEELNDDLFKAKINALLDRTYAHKMAYEISIILSRESSILKTISNEKLKSELTSSISSLETLYDNFDSFSETK